MAANNGWPEKKGKRPGSRKGKREVVDTHLTPYERIIQKLEDPVGKSEVCFSFNVAFPGESFKFQATVTFCMVPSAILFQDQ